MTVTVTPTVEPANDPPRIRLNVAASAGETAATVLRLDPDGRQREVRTFDGNPLVISGGVALVYDYEAPLGSAVSYSTVQSPATVSAQVTLREAEDRVWLVHVGVPELSMPIRVASLGNRTRRVTQSVLRPSGSEFPVVQTDGARKAPEGVIEVRTDSLAEMARLEALTWDSGVLLLNVPVALGWGVSTCYIAVGDIEESRMVEYAAEPGRYFNFPYLVVDRPAGGSQSDRTWADVVADNATWASVTAKYSSWLDLLAGP